MKQIERSFEQFLRRTGGLEEITLGKSREIEATREDTDSLLNDLRENMRFNRAVVRLLVILHVVLFALALVVCWFKGGDKKYLGLLLGGSGVGVYAILGGLRALWREKVIMDMVLSVLPNISSRQAVEVIQVLFYRLKGEKGGKRLREGQRPAR